jgi:hypothetical protein
MDINRNNELFFKFWPQLAIIELQWRSYTLSCKVNKQIQIVANGVGIVTLFLPMDG